jgi:hypothetical protein
MLARYHERARGRVWSTRDFARGSGSFRCTIGRVSLEPSVNGTNVVLARRAMEALVGADVVARAIASLPRETAEAYTSVGLGWVPVTVVDTVLGAIASEAGWSAERLTRESSRASVETLLGGLWRVMLRFTSDEALIARTPLLYSKTFNVGRLESEFLSMRHAEVTQSGWPGISDLQLIGVATGIETVLRCAGRQDVKVICKRTPPGASFTATWSR